MKPLSKNGFQYLDKNQMSYNEIDLLPFFIFIFKYIFLACL